MATWNSINNKQYASYSASYVTAKTGLTVTTGSFTISNGLVTLPATNAAGTLGVIKINNVTFGHMAGGSTNLFLGKTNGSLSMSGTNSVIIGNANFTGFTSLASTIIVGNSNFTSVNGTFSSSNLICIGNSNLTSLTYYTSNSFSGILIGSSTCSYVPTLNASTYLGEIIGHSALGTLSTNVGNWTIIGYQAAGQTAVGNGDGANLCFGYQASYSAVRPKGVNIGALAASTGDNSNAGQQTLVGYKASYYQGYYYNTAMGYQALGTGTSTGKQWSTAIGANALTAIRASTAQYNIGIGCLSSTTGGGSVLTTVGTTISIGHVGTASTAARIHIGTSQTTCYIAGIYGASAGATAKVALIDDANKIAGLAGASGTVLIGGTAPSFNNSPTLTTTYSTTFDTNVAAAAVTLAGTTLAALGSNSDIAVTITPKGTATIVSAAVYAYGVGGTNRAMLVDNAGNIGNATSSRRFKENIQDLGEDSSPIMNLRPVSFNYKTDIDKKNKSGLIAEEVVEIIPEIVVFDDNHEVFSVNYNELPSLILNEFLKFDSKIKSIVHKIENLELLMSIKGAE